jgi:hypothetical protein
LRKKFVKIAFSRFDSLSPLSFSYRVRPGNSYRTTSKGLPWNVATILKDNYDKWKLSPNNFDEANELLKEIKSLSETSDLKDYTCNDNLAEKTKSLASAIAKNLWVNRAGMIHRSQGNTSTGNLSSSPNNKSEEQ